MKIAHINYFPAGKISGVEKKLLEQAKASRKIGLDIDFFVLNSLYNKIVDDNLHLKKIELTSIGILNSLCKKICKFYVLDKFMRDNKYDLIILRYPGMDILPPFKFLKRYGDKVVTEHHTNELAELKIENIDTIRTKIKYALEKVYAPYFLKRVLGVIGVTDEIRKIEIKKAGQVDKPSFVFSNGINVDEIPFTGFKKFDEVHLSILFIASNFSSWHGLDKILRGLLQYNGDVFVELHLVGCVFQKEIDIISKIKNSKVAIYAHGNKCGDELNKYFEVCNIAISSLALHRKNMKEACALKTREYIARGLPFVYAYKDTDLSGDEDFALLLPADDEPVDIDLLIEFADNVSKDKTLSKRMRNYAYTQLDWSVKFEQLTEFLKKLDR